MRCSPDHARPSYAFLRDAHTSALQQTGNHGAPNPAPEETLPPAAWSEQADLHLLVGGHLWRQIIDGTSHVPAGPVQCSLIGDSGHGLIAWLGQAWGH